MTAHFNILLLFRFENLNVGSCLSENLVINSNINSMLISNISKPRQAKVLSS